MAGKKRCRPIHLHVMVSEEELEQIKGRMAEAGVAVSYAPAQIAV